MKIAVFIATTEGPVRITHLQPDSGDLSVMLLTGTSEEVAVSARKEYQRFVHGNTGAIERVLGRHGTFRMEVSGPIDGGESWQLGVLLAHALLARGRLAQGVDAATEQVDELSGAVLVTGTVNPINRSVGAVNHVSKKIGLALQDLKSLVDRGVEVTVAVPQKNHAEATSAAGAPVFAVNSVDEICEQFEIRLDPVARSINTLAWGAAAAAAAAVAALAGLWTINQSGESSPGVSPPVQVAAGGRLRLEVAELRAVDGATCAGVHLGMDTPEKINVPGGGGGFANSQHSRTLCGLEFTVELPQIPAFAMAFVEVDEGGFADCQVVPQDLNGIAAFSGRRSWSCNLPAQLAPMTYRLVVVSGAGPVSESAQAFRTADDRAALITALERDGVTIREVPHTIIP